MSEIGVFLSSEEHGPKSLVTQAQQAEAAGFRSVMISDHYHPWLDRQGESPFVWSVIGAIGATTQLGVTTGVTCPTVRIHPAIIAHAAATCDLLLEGRFVLGVGSGEALNEHILGNRWPPAAMRLAMLEEAIAVMRALWEGRTVSNRGDYFTVENARIYSAPDHPIPVIVSAFGPEALELAARTGDGFVTTRPDRDAVVGYREHGGHGPTIGALRVCWDRDEARARKTAHELWPTEGLQGQLNQELPMPSHFEDASALVTDEMVADQVPCGPDPERHCRAIRAFLEAGFETVYVNQIGSDQQGFLDFYTRELGPRLDT